MGATDVKEQAQETHLNNPPSGATFLQRTYPPIPPSLLQSSFIPSPEEETTIRETIQDINMTLSSVDDEISRVRATLSALEEYRGTLQTTLAHQQAALSSIRRLPPEILAEIFLFASSGSTMEWPRNSQANQRDSMPWLLCKICSYWRTVAISVPGLWSNILANFLCLPPPAGQSAQNFLALCLARSKNEPLTISFETGGMWARDDLLILESLVAHSQRWQDVSLTIDMFFDLSNALAQAKNKVHSLQRLCIEIAGNYVGWGNHPPSQLLEAFEDAPNLHELYMIDFVHPLPNFRVPWSQLTNFSSKGSTFAEGEFTQIMRQMTTLISFSTEGERILEVASTEPVLLPHLRTLSITNKGSYISKTCQFLTAPNLDALVINAVTPFIAEQTVAMMERSGCKPTNLTMRSSLDAGAVGDENANVVWLLTALPSLTRLELTVVSAAVLILPRLANRAGSGSTPTTQGAPLLPELERLMMEDRLCKSALDFTDALSSRILNDVCPRLRSIELRLFPPAPPKFYELDSLEKVAEENGVEMIVSSD